jgi:hypothetical protein
MLEGLLHTVKTNVVCIVSLCSLAASLVCIGKGGRPSKRGSNADL